MKTITEEQRMKDGLQQIGKLREKYETIEELATDFLYYASTIIEVEKLNAQIPLLKKGSPYFNPKKIEKYNAVYFPLGTINGDLPLAKEIYQSELDCIKNNKKVIKWKKSLSDTDKLLLELN